jgi:hypothetical protein
MCLRSSLRYEVEARESPTFGEFLIERSATDEIAPSLLSRPRIADEWGMPLDPCSAGLMVEKSCAA